MKQQIFILLQSNISNETENLHYNLADILKL
jgi:hypothetical protein